MQLDKREHQMLFGKNKQTSKQKTIKVPERKVPKVKGTWESSTKTYKSAHMVKLH